MLRIYKLERKLSEHDIIDKWDEIMGPAISKHTREIFIRNQVLYIRLDSSVLREELHYGRSKLIIMLNEYAGKEVVKEVVLK